MGFANVGSMAIRAVFGPQKIYYDQIAIAQIKRVGRRSVALFTNGIMSGTPFFEHEIGWTQYNLVTSRKGEILGTYDRLIDCGGKTKEEQVIVVNFDPDNSF